MGRVPLARQPGTALCHQQSAIFSRASMIRAPASGAASSEPLCRLESLSFSTPRGNFDLAVYQDKLELCKKGTAEVVLSALLTDVDRVLVRWDCVGLRARRVNQQLRNHSVSVLTTRALCPLPHSEQVLEYYPTAGRETTNVNVMFVFARYVA